MVLNIAGRLEKLRKEMEKQAIGALLVSQPENRFYLSGFSGTSGYLFITGQKAVLATDFRYIEQAGREAPDYQHFQTTQDTTRWLPELLNGIGNGKLGFEMGHVTVAQHRELNHALKTAGAGLKLVPLKGLIESLRMIKEPEEIELIRQAVKLTRTALEYAAEILEVGRSEQQIAWQVEKFLREGGSQTLPFEVMVASGPNAALPHARPSPRTLQAGEPIIIDVGARVSGYTSDMTRTFCLGTPGETYARVYDTVLRTQQAAISAISEAATGQEIDKIAREVIERAGYGAAFGHALGHGLGLSTHEPPRLGPGSPDRIKAGMVFTVEPGIYLSGWGGVRLEDDVVLAHGKTSVISD